MSKINKKNSIIISLSLFVLSYFFALSYVDAATLYIFPTQSEVYEGDSIIAELRLNTEGEQVNTIEATVVFAGEGLEITDFSMGGSIFTMFITSPEIRTDENSVFFQAVVPAGFSGEGVVGRITLLAKNTGSGTLRIAEDSKVLLNDGKGTEADLKFTNGEYNIVEKPEGLILIGSKGHPVEDKWYSNSVIYVFWETKPDAFYSYVLARDPNEVPDEVPDEPAGDIKLTTSEEGVFYFRLRECVAGVCGPVSTRKIMKDNTPPEPFEPVLGQEDEIFGGKKFLSFATEDKVSGISYWEVYEGEKNYVARSPYVLQNQEYKGDIIIKAYDKAGNERQAVISTIEKKSTYNIVIMFGIIIIAIVAGMAVIFWLTRIKNHKKYNQVDSVSQNDSK